MSWAELSWAGWPCVGCQCQPSDSPLLLTTPSHHTFDCPRWWLHPSAATEKVWGLGTLGMFIRNHTILPPPLLAVLRADISHPQPSPSPCGPVRCPSLETFPHSPHCQEGRYLPPSALTKPWWPSQRPLTRDPPPFSALSGGPISPTLSPHQALVAQSEAPH